MSNPYTRAPHQGSPGSAGASSPHAALLIDFDNVTMGMRSDLSKELKSLLASDVIKGKVSVQRAYADWRRYPQYIVPLSEASVDLIFAPAYGSNKKNATDIRMAIDAVELVFIRPEIGTFILLTGDSDFSSLVLKLKEYGKYVIGVGIQESSSDILVQNCDEYYSYTSLTGLTRTTDLPRGGSDPWVLVKEAVAKMVSRDDVMRSDRLKQVMQEIDSSFDESALGFSKFSKFLTEASSRGLVKLRKLDNGQYEIEPARGGGRSSSSRDENGGRGRRDRRPRGRGRDRRERDEHELEHAEAEAPAPIEEASAAESEAAPADAPAAAGAARSAEEGYDILRRTLERLREGGRTSVRDSDVKRKILEQHPEFDEAEYGFSKFSKFLSEAVARGVIVMSRPEDGAAEVSLPGAGEEAAASAPREDAGKREEPKERAEPAIEAEAATDREQPAPETATAEVDGAGHVGPTVIEVTPPPLEGRKLGPRRGSTRRRSHGSDEVVPLLEGQTVPAGGASAPSSGAEREEPSRKPRESSPAAPAAEAPATKVPAREAPASQSGLFAPAATEVAPSEAPARAPDASPATSAAPTPRDRTAEDGAGELDPKELGLPSDPEAIVRYMANRYKGVGQRTAETVVEHFGERVFAVLRDEPDRIRSLVPPKRAEQLLEAWTQDYERRAQRGTAGAGGSSPGR